MSPASWVPLDALLTARMTAFGRGHGRLSPFDVRDGDAGEREYEDPRLYGKGERLMGHTAEPKTEPHRKEARKFARRMLEGR